MNDVSARKRFKSPLTAREKQIIRFACQGLSRAQLAVELSITEKTVSAHLNSSFRKLSEDNRTILKKIVDDNRSRSYLRCLFKEELSDVE